MAKIWRVLPHDADRIERLAAGAQLPPVVAQLLICRGLDDPAAAKDFLEVKLSQLRAPELLPGLKSAVEHLAKAVADKRRIVVYGDYDVDGMTASAILLRCLKLLNANVTSYVPSRMDEGYGLNEEAIRKLAAEGAQLVITVDCGVCSVNEVAVARELGLDIIITDHHALGPKLPYATAIVHPQLPGGSYPFFGLSGAGVAFKVAWALCQQVEGAARVSERLRNFLLHAVGLAALGTIADMVPLIDENRVLVQSGLKALKERPGVGVAALVRVSKLDKKACFECEDVGFALAPRLNAAGRLNQAQLGVELLTTDSEDRAQALAEYLDQLNGSRQSLERSIYLAASKQAEQFDLENDAALVLADRGWHPGVIGIVAGRLAEKYHRPVVMIALDELGVKPGVGSARSIPGFSLHHALAHCSDWLVAHGGHEAAAGLKIDEAQLEHFRHSFCEHAASEIRTAPGTGELRIDAEVTIASLTPQVIEHLDRLAPFGHSNPRPLFCACELSLAAPPKKMGEGERHVSFLLKQHEAKIRAVAFGKSEWADEIVAHDSTFDVAFRPVINEFKGRRSVELHLVAWRKNAENATRTTVSAAHGA